MLNQFIRVVHVLAIGIWAGTCVLFNGVVALKLVWYFQQLPANPTPGLADVTAPVATRMFGELIATIFPAYFTIQAICGVLAAVTSWRLAHLAMERWERIRAILITAVAIAVLIHIGTLYQWSTVVRKAQYAALDAGDTERAEQLRKKFFSLHGPSLILDFTTTAGVLLSLGMLGPTLRLGNNSRTETNRP